MFVDDDLLPSIWPWLVLGPFRGGQTVSWGRCLTAGHVLLLLFA